MEFITLLKRVGAAAGVLIVALSINTSYVASSDAKETAKALAKVQYVQDVRDWKRATGACKSSKDLRALILNQTNLLIPADFETNPLWTEDTRERAREYLRLTHGYVDTNPNCQNIPPKPKPLRDKD